MSTGISRFTVALLAVACAAGAPPARADDYPSKATTVIMPLSPSTAFYIALRQVADQIQAKTGKTIVFEPVVGAGGTLGPQRIKRADPDGYTIGITYAAPVTVNPYVEKEPRYDPLKDFSYISMLTRHGILFVAGAKEPFSNLKELVAAAKARPGAIKVGTGATGSYIGLLALQEAAGVQFLNVPYKSSAEFVPALLSGEVDVTLSTVGTEIGQIKAGAFKALFIGSKNRSPLLPNAQSISETYPNIEVISWYGLYAPAGLAPERLDWLYRQWTVALKDPQMVDKMQNSFGYEIVAGTPQELLDQVKREIPVNSRIAKQYHVEQ